MAFSRVIGPDLRSEIDLGALGIGDAVDSAATGFADGAGEFVDGLLLVSCFAVLEFARFLRTSRPTAAAARMRTTNDTPTSLPRGIGDGAGVESSIGGRGFIGRGGGRGVDGCIAWALTFADSTVDWWQCGQDIV